MKTKELLQSYANGDRQFHNIQLRGQSLRGLTLCGADFTDAVFRDTNFTNMNLEDATFTRADIRGCDFRGTNLAKATFHEVITGQSRRQFLIRITLIGAGGIIGIVASIVLGLIAFFITTTFLGASPNSGGVVTGISAVGVVFAIAFTFTSGLAVAGARAAAIAGLFAFTFTFALGGIFLVIYDIITSSSTPNIIPSIGIILFIGLSIYLFCELIKVVKSLTGNDFRTSDLTDVDFSHTDIYNSDFSTAKINLINWTGVKFHQCRFPASFVDSSIHRLCISRDGQGENYQNANLKNLNLAGVNLIGVNLAEADLSGSDLTYAKLERANLTKAQAFGTNFSNATLTGACIENWGINPETTFTDIGCEFIYLELNQQERKPASGSFKSGDFEKLVQRFAKTLDFLFRNGIDPQAFDLALKNLSIKNQETLSINSITDLGDGLQLLSLNVSNDVDKSLIHREVIEKYQLLKEQLAIERQNREKLQYKLARAEGQIEVYQRNQDSIFSGIFTRSTIQVINSQITGDLMSDKKEIQFGDVIGDISGIAGDDISGVAGKEMQGVAGRDISGTVTNAINQLSDASHSDLKVHLSELQSAIESSDLPEKGKAAALEQVKTLAEVSQNPEQPEKKGLGERSISTLKNMVAMLPDTAKLAEACSKLLPLIAKALGLPV